MAVFRTGTITEVIQSHSDAIRVKVEIDEGVIEALGYPAMAGPLAPGDEVVVNTTGISLELGTGGLGFVLWNLSGPGPQDATEGHIVKIRYTPWQLNVEASEAPESRAHPDLAFDSDLQGLPVVACTLHSQLAGVTAGIKAKRPDAKVGYLMTDAAALPLALSDLVRNLRDAGLLDVTCTVGHAFGGDRECINVFSGLMTLHLADRVDAIVVAMGPGVVGTDTYLGHTALEQGQILDAVNALGGHPVAALRISFDDERPRHRGISHHTLTALMKVAQRRCVVAVPRLDPERSGYIDQQLREVESKHAVIKDVDGSPGLALLTSKGLDPTSMGRPMSESPDIFLAAAAAGSVAVESMA
jgi:Protein of unknown function (DUF3866)